MRSEISKPNDLLIPELWIFDENFLKSCQVTHFTCLLDFFGAYVRDKDNDTHGAHHVSHFRVESSRWKNDRQE